MDTDTTNAVVARIQRELEVDADLAATIRLAAVMAARGANGLWVATTPAGAERYFTVRESPVADTDGVWLAPTEAGAALLPRVSALERGYRARAAA